MSVERTRLCPMACEILVLQFNSLDNLRIAVHSSMPEIERSYLAH
jgi:hypothetical protein